MANKKKRVAKAAGRTIAGALTPAPMAAFTTAKIAAKTGVPQKVARGAAKSAKEIVDIGKGTVRTIRRIVKETTELPPSMSERRRKRKLSK